MNIDSLSSTINAMRTQEESVYRCQESCSHFTVNAESRSRMIKWCYQIVDYCRFNRETVAIATSYLDRFVRTPVGSPALKNRKVYQLAAMTCLYTATKIFEPTVMSPKIMVDLSRGVYTEKQITDMESTILSALQWRVNPPTAKAFVRLFVDLMMSSSMTETIKEDLIESAGYQLDISVTDQYFVPVNPSSIALASIANALDSSPSLSDSIQTFYLNIISNAAAINRDCPEFRKIQARMALPISKSSTGAKTLSKATDSPITNMRKSFSRRDSWKESPRGVIDEQ